MKYKSKLTACIVVCSIVVLASLERPMLPCCPDTAWLNGMNLIFKGDGMLSQHRLLTKDNFHEYDYKAHTHHFLYSVRQKFHIS